MDNSKELYIRQILFDAECQLQGMIAENKWRESRNESLAYTEDAFINLSEFTKLQIQKIS